MIKSKRNEKIEVPLTQDEKDIVVAMAKKQGLPTATYIRWKLLKKRE